MLVFSVLVILLITVLILYVYKCLKSRHKNFPPGPPKLPLWGSYWFLLIENYNHLHLATQMLAKRYKTNVLGFYMGETPTVITLNYELTKEMLKRDEFMERIDNVVVRTRSQGEPKGILFANGDLWQSHRRFSLRHMREYGFGRRSDVMENFVADEIKYMITLLQSDPKKEDLDVCKTKGVVRVPDFFYGSLINIIMLVLSSTQFDHHKVRKHARAALSFLQSGDSTGGALCITPWLRHIAPDFFGYTSTVEDNKFLLNFMKEIVDEHLRTFSDDYHRDLIDDYISEHLKRGTDIDYNQLTLVLLDFMFPSPMALGHSIGFFISFIVNNPDVQRKIQEEIDHVVGRSRFPTLDDRENLPYFEASLRELLRILPVAPLGVPRSATEDTTLGGYSIPKGSLVLPNLWSALRDPLLFPNPEKFEPERFLDDQGHLQKKDLTMAFGAGKRLCGGETYARNTMFLITTAFVQNFNLKSANGKPLDTENLIGGVNLTLKDAWISMTPR